MSHEVSVVSTLEQALEATCPREVCATAMAPDKKNVGALDSACNRTVCGRAWLESYLAALRETSCWEALRPLLATESEKETFKFGNDGTKASLERHRLPVTVGDTVVCVWASVVEVPSLGLLLGRDFLEAIGGVISFTRRALRADHLDCRRIPLQQLSAGHFYLELLPKTFFEDVGRRWTRQGADAVLEVQVSCAEWARRRAAAVKPNKQMHVHEQLSLEASSARSRRTLSRSKALAGDPIREGSPLPYVARAQPKGRASMPPPPAYVPAASRAKRVAFRWCAALAAAAALSAVCPSAVQQHPVGGGMEGAGGDYGEGWSPSQTALSPGCHGPQVRRRRVAEGRRVPERPIGNKIGLHGRPDAPWNAGGQVHQGCQGGDPEPTGGPPPAGGRGAESQRQRVGVGQVTSGTQGRAANVEGRPSKAGGAPARGGTDRGHRGQVEGQTAADRGSAESVAAAGHPRDSSSELIGGPASYPDGEGRTTWRSGRSSRRFAGTTCTTSSTRRSHGWADGHGPSKGRGSAATNADHDRGPGPANGRDARAGHAAHDDNAAAAAAPAGAGWGWNPLSSGQRLGLSESGRGYAVKLPPLRQQLKSGQRLQAWRKGKRDRDLVKVGAKELRDALEVTWAEDWDRALSAPFVAWASDRPMPQRSGFGDLLLTAAATKGHAVTGSSQLPAPCFLLLRAVGRSPLLNLRPSSRPAAEKKSLEAEAAVMAEALAHRRSGRHFFLELLRGADPYGTPEGRELMDEPSLFDFSVNGVRYVTSSPAVAKVFCDKGEAVDATAVLRAIEEQFGVDHQTGNVTETLAAETDLESDLAVGQDGSDTEDEATNQEPDKEVPVSAAVRQAVRRLHENTGHRSPKRLARALVIAGAPMEAVIAAKQLRCSVCEEKRPPKAQRPASLPAPREAGDQIALDIFDAFDAVGTRFSILHAVDAVTRFQMAEVVDKKSSQEVVRFLKERWCPVFGTPRTIVMDQGREFISHEVERYAIESNVYLFFISVQAPWQNGLCERVGGMLKTVLAAATASQSLMGLEEMKTGLGEALLAYNMDVGDSGFSPMQAAVGRQPLPPENALGNNRLGEIDSMDQPGFSRLVAVREAARMAMLRLHFSSSLRRAEKARSRNPTVAEAPAVGDLVYYWREQKYNRRGGVNKRRLLLRKWHGPGLLVAFEGNNCYVTARGTLTKVALEHVRRASPMEQIASGEWDAVLQEVVAAAERDQEWEMIGPAARQDDDGTEHDDLPEEGAPVSPELPRQSPVPGLRPGTEEIVSEALPEALPQQGGDVPSVSAELPRQSPVPGPGGPFLEAGAESFRGRLREAMMRSRAERGRDLPPVSAEEFVRASASESSAPVSRRPSTLVGPLASRAASQEPTTPRRGSLQEPVPAGAATGSLEGDLEFGGTKRPAEVDAEALREQARGPGVPFDALVLEKEAVLSAARAGEGEVHPLVRLQAQAALDRAEGRDTEAPDHGTWDGRWPLPRRTEFEAMTRCGLKWPTGREAFAVQAARKEYHWRTMTPEQRQAFKEAAAEAWNVWIKNDAVEVLSEQETEKTLATLRQRGELHKVLTPRYVFTDKHDGVRTETNKLPLKASARLVVPGYKDVTAFDLRKDAPTASRTSQHLLFSVGASKFKAGWRTGFADVKSAFLNTLLDYRSHRLQRVCRSTFAAELLGVEEGFDVGQYCRGHWAEALGYNLAFKNADRILDLIGLIVVTDAKDTYDKGNSDTPSYGSQKSLAFTVAWLRGMIAKPNVALRWTATSNMFVDAGTKDMPQDHMRQTLDSGEWSFRYDEKYVKQAIKPKKPSAEGPAVLTGTEVAPHDPMIGFLQGLCNQPGWHKRNDMAIQVAFRAKSFRRPEPRFEPQKYPLRSTFALYHDQSGRGAWRLLEKDCRYGWQLKPLDREAPVLITLFRTHKEKETNVEAETCSSGPEQCVKA